MRRTLLVIVILAVAAIAALAIANWPTESLPAGTLADRIVVEKRFHRLTLYGQGQVIRTYRVSLGAQPMGKKERESDNRTPEGIYRIDRRNARSSCHLALHISYPNAQDTAHARALGVSPGGDIMIHGLPNGLGWLGRLQRLHDWTAGCVAVTDREIDEIARAVPDGTPIEIVP